MTARQFAGLIGVALALAGIIALSLPISTTYDGAAFGDMGCGSALSSDTDWMGGALRGACEDAVGTRRAWGWPLAAVGAVVGAGGGPRAVLGSGTCAES